jgi:hypothetical protein
VLVHGLLVEGVEHGHLCATAIALDVFGDANDTTKSVPNRSSVGSAMVIRSAGKKIRRAVAMASPMANARIIHSLCSATLRARTWRKPLIRAMRNTIPKRPMTAL